MERVEDLALVRRFKKGDEGAFNELVRRYQERIYRLCHRMVRNADDAQDLTQDAFVKAYLSLGKFREKSTFYTWIYRIAVNLCINFSRRDRGPRRVAPEPVSGNPETELTMRATKRAIDEAISRLPPRQRAVFVMRQYEGMSYEEISQVTRRSVGSLKANHHHAVFKLRDMLKEHAR